jgi:hypothetical protein
MIERILARFPAHWLLFLAKWGFWLFDLWRRVSKQFWRSYTAFMATFMDEIVGWPLDSPYPTILTDYYPRGVYFYGAEYYTTFNISTRQILFVDQNKPHVYETWKNPYLALTVLENGTEIADLSNWIETVKVLKYKETDYFYPLQILLLCYAYENNISLKYSDMYKYTFSVFTMDGEMTTLDIRGNKEVLQVDEAKEDNCHASHTAT